MNYSEQNDSFEPQRLDKEKITHPSTLSRWCVNNPTRFVWNKDFIVLPGWTGNSIWSFFAFAFDKNTPISKRKSRFWDYSSTWEIWPYWNTSVVIYWIWHVRRIYHHWSEGKSIFGCSYMTLRNIPLWKMYHPSSKDS